MNTSILKPLLSLRRWVLLLVLAGITAARGGEWPGWRGPSGTGVSLETNLPSRWSTNENIRWRVPLPAPGNSTPVIWGRRVFVTQAIGDQGARALLCFERDKGKLLWQRGTTHEGKELTHETNPQCSASPVTDGRCVIASFGSAGLWCFDMDGRELWHRDLGEQRHIWGSGASPIIHDDLCIMNFGPGKRTFLVALDKMSGKELWRVEEAGGHSGEKIEGEDKPPWIGSWSTPIVIKAGGRDELILCWPNRVAALAPSTGKELWTCSGLNPLVYTSPLYDPSTGTVVAMGGFNGMSLAVRAGGSGDVTESRRLWHHPKTKQRIGSGVIHAGHIYILNDPGVAECFELQTGKLVWEERLSGPGPKSDNWSSLMLAGDRLYAINQSGDAFLFRASPEFKLLATNSLGEPAMSSIAASDGDLFIRTHQSLWCIR